MRRKPRQTQSSDPSFVSMISVGLVLAGLACLIATFAKTESVSPPHLLIPRAAAMTAGPAAAPSPAAVSLH